MNDVAQTRGRPPLADSAELRSRALNVLLESGYHNVTMAELAREVGLSVRTLHRYFPAKADIVWGGLEGSVAALRSELDNADDRLPVIEAITRVVVRVFARQADELEVTKTRLRLIATTPELHAARQDTYRLWKDETVAYIARRLEMSVGDVVPLVAGAAVQTVIMEALTWWAGRQDGTPPVDAVVRALRGLPNVIA